MRKPKMLWWMTHRHNAVIVEPTLRLRTTYDDNLRASGRDRRTDVITRVQPAVAVRSDWPAHAVNLRAGLRVVRHARTPRENHVDADLNLNGHLDPTPATDIDATLHLARDHEDRADPEARGGIEPTPIHRASAEISARHRFTDLTVRLGGRVRRSDFADVSAAGGRDIDNDSRDRRSWQVSGRGTYRVFPGLKTFLAGRYGRTTFTGDAPRDGLDRDAQRIELVTGTRFAITALTFGEAFTGLHGRSQADPRLGRTVGIVSGLSVTSTITPLITLRLQMDRSVQATTVRQAAAVRSTGLRLGYDHEVLRRLMLGVDASYTHNSFVGIRRVDTLWTARFRVDYRLSSAVELTARYAHSRRNSTGNAAYRRNRVALGVALRY